MKSWPGLLAAAILLAAGAARAQPPEMKLSLAYDGRLFIKVLDIQFNEAARPGGFGSNVKLRSYGVLALFKRFDITANASGRIEGGEPRPLNFGYINHDGERTRDVKVAWTPGQVSMNSTPPFSNLGQPPASQAQALAAADPLTQMMRIALAQSPAGACGTTRRFFDGKQLYDLAFGPAQPAQLRDDERGFGLVNPVQCSVRYIEVAGFKAKSPEKRGQGLNGAITAVMGRLGDGGPWVFASLSADTKLGKARIVLRKAEMTGAKP